MAREAEGLTVEWSSTIRNGWVTIQAKGDDSEAFSNFLRKKYGEIPVQMQRVQKWDVLQGFATGIGQVGFGLYIDIGILEPTRKDALYPLHRMRAQLSDGRQASAREILAENAMVDNSPVTVVVTGLDGDKITVELDDTSREMLVSWRDYPWDRIIAVGLTRDQASNTLRRLRIESDIIEVEPLSLFVQSFLLKVGTEAPGIISRIGRGLRGVTLAAYTMHKRME